ncbi:type II secretion system F family protein [Aliarcobacter butzleri]|uniref:type II secretion system F family protein n=1 Tax=Aliarcobacter butzleri TaxID=28197 RepID=UPI0006786A39|nr:type II secretion system F family protein [Aliarcobacter butzleri]MCT7556967.1 type II secretion system F family protein [Aliarcobacter butzleri]MCT7565148.1 type II secretion system F family protein [Aliarcobacter butzleri]MCT7570687.1 type II secretion system F family protein [Aliarcobacter butzleri]MCT7645373.1 type II secretion system F family protein [Aliarcobacter butzleri]MDK2081052.1 type II secretion system F family protein [Aliarcobacter butzleri]
MKKYKIKYQKDEKVEELILKTSDLANENLPQNILEIKEEKESFKIDFKRKIRIDNKKMNLLFYELNLMLQSNINFSDALDILIKNRKDKDIVKLLQIIKESFSSGKSIDENLKEFNINHLVISFLRNCQNSGNITLNINALSKLLIENSELKKSFYKAISYPIFLFITFFLSIATIFTFVIPKFKTIFFQVKDELPLATKILLIFENFFVNYSFYFFCFFSFIIIFIIYFYKQNTKFEYFIDKFMIRKIVLFKDIYLNMQLYKFFLLIDIMLKSNYEFYKAFISSKLLLKNKYLLDKIYIIDNLLQNGKSINNSFSKTKLFDDIVLNLINTGEISNSLVITIDEIKKIYKNRFDDKMSFLISLIQPIFLVTIMGLILWIVLAIFMPIWNMGNMINI